MGWQDAPVVQKGGWESAPIVKQADTGWADPAGKLSSFVRNAANAATFNLADPSAAAIGALLPVKGYTSTKPTYGERYNELLGWSRGDTAKGQQTNPGTALAGSVVGGFLNPATRALPVARTIGGAALQGGAVGAGYGVGEGISNQDGVGGIAKDAAIGGLTGGALGGTLHGAGNLIRGAVRNPDAALLNANNIPTTIGQDLGGGYKRAEDAFTSMPYGGDAIIARQREGLGGFNRALENDAIAPVQLQVPHNVAPGNDAGRYIRTVNDAAYDAAYQGATVQHSPQIVADLQGATNHMSNRLAPDAAAIQQDIHDNVIARFDPRTGTLSTADFNDAKNWLAEQARTTSQMTPDQRSVARAYGNALAALRRGFTANDPGRADMLARADTIYSRRMPLVDAAGNTNASARDGVVTPAQFSRAMDSSDGTAHGLNYSLGNMRLQDVVQAGQRALPSSVPDSGTGIRRLLTGGVPAALAAVAGTGAVGLPGLALGALPMVATRALYSPTGQRAAKAALFGAPQTRAALSQLPRQSMPGLLGLLAASLSQSNP